ncbi:MAG: DNA repair protein RecN [Alphaproteobacteria bacterium]|nr:DNA repair protein RecN [Alphaproteobacteria bacterium]
MLAALTVRDIVLIEQAALEFAPGLNVLTGETGAGKSILLDSLGLAVGNRGRAGVRPGAAQGSATAVFDPVSHHGARALLKEQAMPHEGEIVLRRSLAADGKSRAFVNDEAVSVGLLKDLGGLLLEVHGQADDRGLFDVATHRGLLDSFGALDEAARAMGGLYAAWDEARRTLAAGLARAAEAERNADYVRAAAKELSTFDPQPGEEEILAGERALMMNAARIAEDLSAATDALSGERGAEAALAMALKKLSRLQEEARKRAAAAEAALEQAFAQTEEARRELDALLASLDTDTAALERKEERLFELRALARKYATTPDGLVAVLADFLAQRDALDGSGSSLKDAKAAVAQAHRVYLDAARKLSKDRAVAARKLEAAVAAELAPLKLGHAKFRVALEPLADDAGTANGLEKIAFEVATVEGAAFGSLAKIASGGELARFSLALKVALAQTAPPAAMVFDEVDRGVGGAVADAVGERLQRLAETTQVLLVTHSPQVAARAARHFRISRVGDKTRIVMLEDEARLEEIARMLSGASVTEEARAAARRLVAEAARPVRPSRKKAKSA